MRNLGRLDDELSTKALFRLVNDAHRLHAKVISWSGGEALLRGNEFIDLLRHARRMRMKNWVYTNGVVWKQEGNGFGVADDELLGKVAKLSDRIMLSVQGDSERIVDPIMDAEGAFRVIVDAVRSFRRSGAKWVEGHFVPMRPNFRRIKGTADLWLGREHLDRLSFLRFVRQGRGAQSGGLLELDAEEMREVNRILRKLQDEWGSERVRVGRPLSFGFLPDPRFCQFTCRAGLDAPLVGPDGRIDACPAWKMLPEQFKLGHLNTAGRGLIEAWTASPVATELRRLNLSKPEELRRMLSGSCLDCRFFGRCRGGCAAQRIRQWGTMYKTPDPACPKSKK
jgi:radical SAM protein with 4Fe4S-binding SPASM domain